MNLRSSSIRIAARALKPFKLARHPFFRSLYRRMYRAAVPEGDCRVKLAGMELFVDPHDSGVGYQLYIGRPYEETSTRLFERELRPGMVVVDLGANIGYYALLAAALVGPEGHVYAYEPEPENFALLRRSIEHNGLTQLEAHQVACSDANGSVTLRTAERGKGLATIGAAGDGWGSVEVQAARLDDLLHAQGVRPDFIKMDIEGVEPQAVRGMEQLLRARPGLKLLTELHPMALGRNGTSAEAYLDQLLGLGLRIESVVDEVADTETAMGREELLALCERRPKEVKDWSCNVLLVAG